MGCGGAKPWWADADELAVEMRFWIEVPGWRGIIEGPKDAR